MCVHSLSILFFPHYSALQFLCCFFFISFALLCSSICGVTSPFYFSLIQFLCVNFRLFGWPCRLILIRFDTAHTIDIWFVILCSLQFFFVFEFSFGCIEISLREKKTNGMENQARVISSIVSFDAQSHMYWSSTGCMAVAWKQSWSRVSRVVRNSWHVSCDWFTRECSMLRWCEFFLPSSRTSKETLCDHTDFDRWSYLLIQSFRTWKMAKYRVPKCFCGFNKI